ncbi:hypothetical protein THH46_17750 [Pseudomonas sp. NA13]
MIFLPVCKNQLRCQKQIGTDILDARWQVYETAPNSRLFLRDHFGQPQSVACETLIDEAAELTFTAARVTIQSLAASGLELVVSACNVANTL